MESENSEVSFGKRLLKVREDAGFTSRKAFAAEFGIHPETLRGYERGANKPDFSLLRDYSQRFSVDLHWLLTGAGDMLLPDQKPTFKEISEAKGLINLPMYQHVHASAGPGALPVGEKISSAISFEEKYLRDMGATPAHCVVIEARGDSMSPGIIDGALLIVDLSQTTVDDGRIYVFNVGETVVVKRASWSLSQKLTLKSDNPAYNYPDDTFSKEDAEALSVVGRVVFQGRRV